jgi:predicted glutamine amidotransferase
MCRLLYVRSKNKFDIHHHLEHFSGISKNSKEFQGHGWGCSYLVENEWQNYKNIKPIWEDDLHCFGKTTLLVAHARSAFRDQDIGVENNMPFSENSFRYIFNGEMHGVKIREKGNIGAEKLFNFILRFYKGNMIKALEKSVQIVEKRSRYIKAMNIIIADKERAYVVSYFNEDPGYFSLNLSRSESELILCSHPYPDQKNWQLMGNKTIRKF